MSVRIRARTDHRFIAEHKCKGGERWHFVDAAEWEAVPPAQPGDIWRVRWSGGGVAGYDITCPTCKAMHSWTTSRNCGSRRDRGAGVLQCDHYGVSSCWEWSGAMEDGTLSASPSLWSLPEYGGCGFHGFLTNGILSG